MKLVINNKSHEVKVAGHETLLEVLRDSLGMTGTKTSCNESECGACTVIINNKAVLSCITLASDVEGINVTTIEGLADGEKLHPVQQAFLDNGSAQCGFCIPGMIMSSTALLNRTSRPTQEEIEYSLDGNLCRCTGYLKVFDAIRDAGRKMEDLKTIQEKPTHALTSETSLAHK